jgi:hypothetical protein
LGLQIALNLNLSSHWRDRQRDSRGGMGSTTGMSPCRLSNKRGKKGETDVSPQERHGSRARQHGVATFCLPASYCELKPPPPRHIGKTRQSLPTCLLALAGARSGAAAPCRVPAVCVGGARQRAARPPALAGEAGLVGAAAPLPRPAVNRNRPANRLSLGWASGGPLHPRPGGKGKEAGCCSALPAACLPLLS